MFIIFLSLFLGLICGFFLSQDFEILGVNIFILFQSIGQTFINALKMIVVPLIISALIYSIVSIKVNNKINKIGIYTFSYYLLSSFIAICIGMFFVNTIKPGISDQENVLNNLGLSDNISKIDNFSLLSQQYSIQSFFDLLIPNNILEAIVSGNMIAIVFFSILFGYALRSVKTSLNIVNFWEIIYHTMVKIMNYILMFLPIGIFCLITTSVSNWNSNTISIISYYFVTVLISLSFYSFIILPLVLKIFGINIRDHFSNIAPALISAFSTSSSMATIPITSRCLINQSKLPKENVNFIVPLGATINMDGTALFECVVVIFIVQIYGFDISLSQQFLILFFALITSVGVAGVPSASFVAIVLILNTLGLPLDVLVILLGVDRILDMSRTAVNVLGDSCCAAVVSSKIK